MKSKKGITLVALIITIIVMVILAGVIIASAVAEGGIIDRAEYAMKENERADVEEIIIGSYVFKVTASTSTVGTLDLPKTGIAIYENLISNGFEVDNVGTTTDENGNTVNTVIVDETNQKIDIVVKGKHGDYTGTVKEKGLENGIGIVNQETIIPEDTSDSTNDDIIVDEKYSFTINEFESYTEEVDSRIGLDITKIWEVVGVDLSKNTDYVIEPDSSQPMFVLTANNTVFQGMLQVMGGMEELRDGTKYMVFADIAFGRFELGVFDTEGNEVLRKNPSKENEISYAEFVRVYGDVEFEFVNISGYTLGS